MSAVEANSTGLVEHATTKPLPVSASLMLHDDFILSHHDSASSLVRPVRRPPGTLTGSPEDETTQKTGSSSCVSGRA